MTKVLQKLKSLSTSTKIQLLIALILTVALVVAIPVYAWFTNERKIAELAKIKAPDDLYINAAHREDVIYLDMTSVNVSNKVPGKDQYITSQSFVFTVSGEWVNSYTLQIEHTTNTPFRYSFHKGILYKSLDDLKEADPAGYEETYGENYADMYEKPDTITGALPYVEYTATNVFDQEELSKIAKERWGDADLDIDDGEKYFVWIGDEITNIDGDQGEYFNMTGSGTANRYANDTYTDKSYESGTYYQRYANPVYWQLNKIKASDSSNKGNPFYNTYVIKLDWTGVDTSKYKKETDIFYISAFVE